MGVDLRTASDPPKTPRADAFPTGSRLARFHGRIRRLAAMQRFTLFLRAMLFLGFSAPGLTKLIGLHFAPGIDPTTPMGRFFEAFHDTGAYYAFVGGVQMLAAGLLLSRRWALLGACLYTVIIGNIWVLVTATHFGVGTPLTTGLMTLGALWLLAWDGHRLAPLLAPRGAAPVVQPSPPQQREPALWDLFSTAGTRHSRAAARMLHLGFVLGLGGGWGLTLFSRGLLDRTLTRASLVAVAVGGLLTLAAWVWGAVAKRRGAAAPGSPPSVSG